jgi:hypothetical protein
MKKPDDYITSADDLFSVFMMHKRSDKYGIKKDSTVDSFIPYLVKALDSKWIEEFVPDRFSLRGDSGVSLSSMRLAEVLSTMMKD